MADITYPDYLPDFKIGKSRQEGQTYTTTRPLKGAYYTEKITDDVAVIWEGEFMCNSQNQSRLFWQFLESVKGGRPFIKNILTEYGFVPHEITFVQEPRAPRQVGTLSFSYPCVVRAQKLVTPKVLLFRNIGNF